MSDRIAVQFAGIAFSLIGLPDAVGVGSRRRFGAWQAPVEADAIPVHFVFELGPPLISPPTLVGLEEPFELNFTVDAVHFRARLFSGCVELALSDSSVRSIHVCLTTDNPDDVAAAVENVLRVGVAYALLARGGLLVHSAALVSKERAILLVGQSGAGKSTASATALQVGHRVLSDELNALVPDGSGYAVHGVPFAGDHYDAAGGKFALAGLYALTQASARQPGVKSVAKLRLVSSLVAASPFVNTHPHLFDALCARALQLVDAPRIARAELALELGGDAFAYADAAFGGAVDAR